MRTHRKSLFLAMMAIAMPFYMSDETASAAPSEDPNAVASAADASQESGTTQSATTATDGSATDTTAAAAGDTGNADAGAAASTGATESAAASSGDAPVVAEVPADAANTQPAIVADPSAFGHVQTDATGQVTAASTVTTNESTGKVEVAPDAHAEAKDRFAGVLAKLHQFEDEALDELRADLVAIGTLLHLHSAASGTAQSTGDYKAADLS